MKLKSKIWIDAFQKHAELAGAYVTIIRSGYADAGSIVVCIDDGQSTQTFQQSHDMNGAMVWRRGRVFNDSADLNAYIASQTKIDPDIWIVEVFDKSGRTFLQEPIVD